MSKAYRPSNGTEGEIFMAKFCENCDRMNYDGDYEPCWIVGATMAYGIDDPGYPEEWIEDESGPRCTAYTEDGERDPPVRCDKTMDMFNE